MFGGKRLQTERPGEEVGLFLCILLSYNLEWQISCNFTIRTLL